MFFLIFITMSLKAAQKQRIADLCWSVRTPNKQRKKQAKKKNNNNKNREKILEWPVLTVNIQTTPLNGKSFSLLRLYSGIAVFIQAEVMTELHLFFCATCECAVQGLPSTCRMLHCWMVVCCSWLASCCRV